MRSGQIGELKRKIAKSVLQLFISYGQLRTQCLRERKSRLQSQVVYLSTSAGNSGRSISKKKTVEPVYISVLKPQETKASLRGEANC